MADTAKRIEELRQAIMQASLNYEIWWAYKSEDTRPRYVTVMNRYAVHFHAAINAHFVAMLIPLYRLFEKSTQTHNIPQLLKHLRKHTSIKKTRIDDFQARFDSLKPLWEKVYVLRNEAFGHRAADQDISDVFKKASVTPNGFRDLIDGVKELLNDVSSEFDSSFHAFNTGAYEETVKMLDDLKSVGDG